MLGIIFCVLGLVAFVLSAVLFARSLILQSKNKSELTIFKSLLKFSPLFALSVFLFAMNWGVFYAEPGHQYFVQYPWGEQKCVFSSGYKLRWWGNVLPFRL